MEPAQTEKADVLNLHLSLEAIAANQKMIIEKINGLSDRISKLESLSTKIRETNPHFAFIGSKPFTTNSGSFNLTEISSSDDEGCLQQ